MDRETERAREVKRESFSRANSTVAVEVVHAVRNSTLSGSTSVQ